MARESNGAENVVWFLTGMLTGATLAILFAPASGEETRRIIHKKAKKSGETVAEHSQRLMDRGKTLYEKGKKMADEAADMLEQGRKLVQG